MAKLTTQYCHRILIELQQRLVAHRLATSDSVRMTGMSSRERRYGQALEVGLRRDNEAGAQLFVYPYAIPFRLCYEEVLLLRVLQEISPPTRYTLKKKVMGETGKRDQH